jgi:hypothetical protein
MYGFLGVIAGCAAYRVLHTWTIRYAGFDLFGRIDVTTQLHGA